MRISKIGSVLVLSVLIGAFDAWSCLGADEEIQLKPRAIRPGGTITVKPAQRLDPGKPVFLRLTGPSPVDDLPAPSAEVGRGVFHITLPKEMRQGKYDVQLVSERGDVLASGVRLKVLATETPTISKIVPYPSYAIDGRYSFEIVGENFGNDADETTIRINDIPIHFETPPLTDRGRRLSVANCESKLPCLIGNRRRLQVFGLSLDKQPFYRPMNVSVQVDSQVSAGKPLLLSWAQRRTPAILAFAVLGILAALVVLLARQKAAQYQPFQKRYGTLAYLFIDPETNTYSLSRLQLILWTAAAVVAYVYLAASQNLVQWKWQLPEVPEGLPTLLGLSVGTTALAIGATEARGSKGAGPAHPGIGDFITNGGVFASERLQFFLWTILGVCGFVSATLAHDPATLTELPKIPDNFLPLMGVSALGYLAGKVLRKPGPIIKQLVPPPPYTPGTPVPANGIRIVGENLSPRAQVWINGVLIPAGDVGPATQAAAGELVPELVVMAAAATTAISAATPPAGPTTAPAPAAKKPPVRVVNPDGQSAEI